MRTALPALAILLALGTGTTTHAETVVEWKFDGPATAGGELVPATTAVPKGSPNGKLMPGSSIVAEPTGISDKWSDFLQNGFLRTGRGNAKNQFGLKTEPTGGTKKGGNASYYRYFGFSGLGLKEGGDGGTLYLVFKPNAAWNSPVKRRSLFGTGHAVEGQISLRANEQKQLVLNVGCLRPESKKNAVASILTTTWEPDTWYFLAASWQESSDPILFLRKLSPEGAKTSPAAILGKATGPAPSPTAGPNFDPLVIGAGWNNPGNDPHTADGADASIAYARIDNTYATEADIQTLFQSLSKE
ncbi:hypothetical protein Ga0100230_019375 [Opitutaceae bacterium TAV3]|nr:hypothetical protein Ga0100230_019375 [Opitutaceae bacterium TAV3]